MKANRLFLSLTKSTNMMNKNFLLPLIKKEIDSILQSWKINYQNIYYTSMYEADQNELNRFKNDFFALLAKGERLAQLSKKTTRA